MNWLEAQSRRVRAIEPVPFDPSGIGDPIALRTEWGPALEGGANFRTHRLLHVGPRRAEFRSTWSACAFYALFAGIGLAVCGGFIAGAIVTWRAGVWPVTLAMAFPIALSGIFPVFGLWLWRVHGAPVVFDRQQGEYWKGRVSPAEMGRRHQFESRVQLDRIHALQLIAERCRSDDGAYYSYELNLVLKDGTRMNVVDHGNLEWLRRDAATLAEFLGKPIWDATALHGVEAPR